ncbi:Zn(2)-Cys(6) binuclear cluster domain-containing protein [Mycena polygramma]|nr:Zn(2)-Cys(6) binuclear cluster domain-containing protein [Mycena polygramma]
MAQEGSSSFSFVSGNTPKACVNCRRRKIKCDGERPKCGQCSRSRAFQDCEYIEDGTTRTQQLEEQIAVLEARIEQLEKPKELRTCIGLHNPYPGQRRSASLPSLSLGGSPADPQLTPGPSVPLSLPTLCSEGIAPAELESLIHKFLHHSSQFGFFLNVDNFRDTILGHPGEPPAAVLLDVVRLWAIHISDSPEFAVYESIYLSRALRTAADPHQQNTILHTIQAKVLLAHYFLRNTRFLEGKYHLSAAVSLVLSSGLHRVRSAEAGAGGPAFLRLPPARDVIEESERVSAFWTVLTMNNCWTTADGSPSNISYTVPDARIDTPWPFDVNTPGLQNQIFPDSSMGTVTTFLSNLPDNGTSESALHAKAAILFEQASRISSQFRPDMSNDQRTQFYASFTAMDTLIDGFKTALPAIHPESSRELLVAHSLTHVAAIQLHNPFVVDVEASRVRALDAAHAVVADFAQVPVGEFGFIDPIMGTLLMATCQVFIAELSRTRRRLPSNSQEERMLLDAIDTVLAIMNVFAPTCRLMQSQLVAMQQLYHGQV